MQHDVANVNSEVGRRREKVGESEGNNASSTRFPGWGLRPADGEMGRNFPFCRLHVASP
ncbi:hypothetical protein CA51_25130 [Rosistilla oblonga]|nr:hypothetical protein CA51_25130 [Rosistilla oblonga]